MSGLAFEDLYDVRRARSATGLLRTFNDAGVLAAADVHVATTLARLGDEPDDRVRLAAALAVRGVRLGSVCVELAALSGSVAVDGMPAADVAALPWPDTDAWLAACAASPLTGPGRPLRLEDGLLYLDRYWRQEEQVRAELLRREGQPPPAVDLDRLRAGLQRLFPVEAAGGRDPEQQRVAAAVSVLRWVSVLAGGPGTGKTTTIARLLALLQDQPGPAPRIALAAPTGKAAARLEEAVREVAAQLGARDRQALLRLRASTLHRLLGRRRDSHTRFRHDRNNRLPYDVVVVDETSMVSLTLMARLLEALRPDARLVLVGDPDQLTSVEAGAVLGDLVHRPAGTADERVLQALADVLPRPVPAQREGEAGIGEGVVLLRHTWRFGGGIAALAQAVQRGDADAAVALLRSAPDDVTFTELGDGTPSAGQLRTLRADVVAAGRALVTSARAGAVSEALARLGMHRLLCAHRDGPYGVSRWSDEVERWLATAVDGYAAEGEWYAGRPLLVTANDYEIPLYNGDTGVVIRMPDGSPRAAFDRAGGPVLLQPARLSDVQTVHAMTVHKSQGSQFARVSLLLPPAESALLTRELLYTAITRAQSHVHLLGTEEAVRIAVGRPVARASGLRRKLDRR